MTIRFEFKISYKLSNLLILATPSYLKKKQKNKKQRF